MLSVQLNAHDYHCHVCPESHRCHQSSTHVCAPSIRMSPQDGNRLYQPADRKQWGPVRMALVLEVMAAMVGKTSLIVPVPGETRLWLFNPAGATPGEDGTVDRGVVIRVAVRRRLSH